MALIRIGDDNAETSSTAGTAGASVTASNAIAAHASSVQGDFVFITSVSKPATAAISAPSGFTAGTQTSLGSGTNGESAGPQRIGSFWRVLPASPTLAPVATESVTGIFAVISAGAITYRPDVGWIVEVTESTGQDTTSGTAVAITGGTVLPFVEGDWMVLTLASPNSAIAAAGFDALNNVAPGGMAGATFNLMDSKWDTGANGGAAGGSQRTITLDCKCNSGPATAVPSLAVTTDIATTAGAKWFRLHPVHLPTHALGIDGTAAGNHFKLQAARDGAGAVYEETQAQLVAGYYEAPYFICVGDPDQDWVRFQVRCDGPNTGGTAYARSELREMGTDGTTDAAWNSASGQHRMRDKMRWPSLPATKPTIVGAQIHDNVQDNLQITTQKNATSGLVECKLRINGSSVGRPTLETNYTANDEHDVMIDITSGVTRVWWDDMVNAVHLTTDIVSSGGAYFKSGCYANFDETDEAAGTYAICEHESGALKVWHTGYSGSAPAPLQLDQPNSLMVCA